jgi:hypothetical protein
VGVLPAVREIDTSFVFCVGLPWLDCKAVGIVFAGFLERVIHAPFHHWIAWSTEFRSEAIKIQIARREKCLSYVTGLTELVGLVRGK